MVSDRKIQALQNLAEGPGTEAEGRVARAMLEKLTGRPYIPQRPAPPPPFSIPYWPRQSAPAAKKRPVLPKWYTDPLRRAEKVRQRFPIGSVIYYNARGCPTNTTGEVIGYERAGFRVRVEFFSGVKLVHACSHLGWHISHSPATPKQAAKLQRRATA